MPIPNAIESMYFNLNVSKLGMKRDAPWQRKTKVSLIYERER